MTCLDCELKKYAFEPSTLPLEEAFDYNYGLQEHLLSPLVQPLFVKNHTDAGTKEFLRGCEEDSASCKRLVLDAVGSLLLRAWVSRTTFNGLLFRGGMHVLSTQQFATHLQRTRGQEGSLLDIGAGDGGVTRCLAPLFTQVCATESDTVMRWRLRQHGFEVLQPEDVAALPTTRTFDVVTCLNVLDRCDRPRTLLRQMRARLAPGGRLLIALVFPFSPFVEDGRRKLRPAEYIVVEGANLEDNINSFVNGTLLPAGFALEVVSRTPYLCQGDTHKPYYLLHDIIFVVTAA